LFPTHRSRAAAAAKQGRSAVRLDALKVVWPMTAQISDTVCYQGRDFSIAGVNGDGLFDPAGIGLKVVMLSTACYRGFYCTYSVVDEHLRLTRLTVGFDKQDWQTAERGEGPVWFGRLPRREQRDCHTYNPKTKRTEPSKYWSDFYYEGLCEPVQFTGGILIGADFIQEMYVHMGFHPAYKYQEVHELVFDAGKLVKASDLSHAMAEFRKDIADRPLRPTDPDNKQEIMQWIERTFSLKYKL
jgi:hypothetical protein